MDKNKKDKIEEVIEGIGKCDGNCLECIPVDKRDEYYCSVSDKFFKLDSARFSIEHLKQRIKDYTLNKQNKQ